MKEEDGNEEDSKTEEYKLCDGSDGDGDGDGGVFSKEGEKSNKGHPYPLRLDAEDCPYYIKTGTCKFGFNCKFNHPLTRRNSQLLSSTIYVTKEKLTEKGEECKYYLTTGGCKFGKACRYYHPEGKILVTPCLELNCIGLPIRLGEKECPYYMRMGSCKYGATCRFTHPDPSSGDPSGNGNGESISLRGAHPSTIQSWTSLKTSNGTPFVPMMFQQPQGIPSRTPQWNSYEAPVYPPPESYVMTPSTETNAYTHEQKQMLLDQFPERPGQPECSYYLRTGSCNFNSNCKYHHPKSQATRPPQLQLSDKGLPLRPDQNMCTCYSLYGICKLGPACKFDHPVHHPSSVSPPSSENPQGLEWLQFSSLCKKNNPHLYIFLLLHKPFQRRRANMFLL